MKATRRAVVAAPGVAALGLAGCTADEPASSSSSASPSTTTATEAAVPDPDRVALDRAVAITAGLIAGLAEATPVIDPARRLAAMHAAHLAALQEAVGASFPPASPPGRPLTAAQLRRRELNAQRELAHLAQEAESGALARVLASMSAGIAAGLSHRGEVPR